MSCYSIRPVAVHEVENFCRDWSDGPLGATIVSAKGAYPAASHWTMMALQASLSMRCLEGVINADGGLLAIGGICRRPNQDDEAWLITRTFPLPRAALRLLVRFARGVLARRPERAPLVVRARSAGGEHLARVTGFRDSGHSHPISWPAPGLARVFVHVLPLETRGQADGGAVEATALGGGG